MSATIVAGNIKGCNLVISIRQPDDLVTVPKAAKQLGHHKTTLYRWWKAKKLYLVEIGGILFIPVSEIERLKNEEATGDEPVA